MNRRVCWALVGSVLLHLGMIGWVRWDGPMGWVTDRPRAEGAEAPAVIQVRLVSGDRPSGPVAAAAPSPSAPAVARSGAAPGAGPRPVPVTRLRMDAPPVAEDGRPAGAAPLPDMAAEGGAVEAPERHKPLVLELPARSFSHAPAATVLQTTPAPDRLRDTLQSGGRVAIQETRGAAGERRATVTTPWGRYCMRERRSAGPYDATRDRGMDSVTCPDG